MNIGDKVRLLKGREEGYIIGFSQDGLVEVEIEDGFTIPVVKAEVVVVQAAEDEHFAKSESRPTSASAIPPKPEKKIIGQKGVFLACLPVNDATYSFHLVNNTDLELVFSAAEPIKSSFQGIAAGKVSARSSFKLKNRSTDNFENWPAISFRLFFHSEGFFSQTAPLIQSVNFKANRFFGKQKTAPILNKQAILYQIDQEEKVEGPTKEAAPIDTKKLKEEMFAPQENYASKTSVDSVTPGSARLEVDLHIESLVEEYKGMSNGDMLELQLSTFENALDRAVVQGASEIKFIHGLGNGVLRNAIHKSLGLRKNILYFEDAEKTKFGNGATLVRIK